MDKYEFPDKNVIARYILEYYDKHEYIKKYKYFQEYILNHLVILTSERFSNKKINREEIDSIIYYVIHDLKNGKFDIPNEILEKISLPIIWNQISYSLSFIMFDILNDQGYQIYENTSCEISSEYDMSSDDNIISCFCDE